MTLRDWKTLVCFLALCSVPCLAARAQPPTDGPHPASSQNPESTTALTLEELKAAGASHSAFLRQQAPAGDIPPGPQLEVYQKSVEPVLRRACVQCHGPDAQEGNIRIDTLDPNLSRGEDVPWWLEVFAVLSNGEMPPPGESELSDDERSQIVDWLSTEIQTASIVRRADQGHSSFRRMTRYEYNYALQDLLGLPYDFAKDLPPEASSEGGFQNSSETLHMSVTQFASYRELARNALLKATVRGEQPAPLYWGVSMQAASADQWKTQDAELEKIRQTFQDDPEKLQQELNRKSLEFQRPHHRAYYRNETTGQTAVANWSYPEAKYAWKPSSAPPDVPESRPCVAVIPPRQRLIVELGDRIPEQGTLTVRVRASRTTAGDHETIPSLQLEFGWQASNDSHASVRIGDHDLAIDAPPNEPRFYQWDIPLCEIYPRNSVRNVTKLGDLPNPSEYVGLVNSSVSQGEILIDYVEVTAPTYANWPPDSHTRIFIDSDHRADELAYARQILTNFMSRAWRRPIIPSEVDQKLSLFAEIRPQCEDFQEAIIEVLATVLSSPKFLYLIESQPDGPGSAFNAYDLATRISIFLWCSIPDDRLIELAGEGRLSDPKILAAEVDRMLSDPRAARLSEHFVHQWLGMQLLEYLKVDNKEYPQFDPALKESMQREPVAFFHEVLRQNHSVLDFLHANYTMADERLARHYGLTDVDGNHFRRVALPPQHRRGGLLTQAGLLAMNSDGKDSHPLKRGIWLLENLLDDPPPPPPPAVPKIDLADPAIAKMTLKERMADHRNQAACRSCHLKIDPWGIALENFDAIGGWRTHVRGQPADAKSVLFNQQELDGVDGLKRFLLEHRQDQFARALVSKLTTYAIGRPLTFSDRAEIDQITAELRRQGDGLGTLVRLIVQSKLFRSPAVDHSPSNVKSQGQPDTASPHRS